VKEYIVCSGNGYFIKFDNDTPFMDSDPVGATRMSRVSAYETMDRLVDLGYYAELIEIVRASLREGEVI